jgi:hypothetical protein
MSAQHAWLAPTERQQFRSARQQGYLLTSSRASSRLWSFWRHWCAEWDRPAVVVVRRRRWAEVIASLSPRYRLSDTGVRAVTWPPSPIASLLAETRARPLVLPERIRVELPIPLDVFYARWLVATLCERGVLVLEETRR